MSREIPLSRGLVAIVDDEDFEWLSRWKWNAQPQGKGERFRAKRIEKVDGKPITIRMHRQIMGAKAGEEVDHINGNPLDNRRTNLRICTHAENSLNRIRNRGSASKFKGVWFHKQRGKWAASFRDQYLGLFLMEEDAARAYDNAAFAFSPDFALTNFLPDGSRREFDESCIFAAPRVKARSVASKGALE